MSRLTERFSNGQAAVAGCGSNCKYDFKYCKFNEENCPTLSEIYDKLAFYEDLEESGQLSTVYQKKDSIDFLKEIDAETLKAELLVFLSDKEIVIDDIEDFKEQFVNFIEEDFSYGDCE